MIKNGNTRDDSRRNPSGTHTGNNDKPRLKEVEYVYYDAIFDIIIVLDWHAFMAESIIYLGEL